jgi:AcrR family transcriptional regulator
MVLMKITNAEASKHSRISEERVNELLDIASEVFVEHGFAAASVGEMARRGKTSKSTYYRRYPRKEDLFVAVIQRWASEFSVRFRSSLASDSPEEALSAFGKALCELVLEPRSIAMVRILYMEARSFPEVAKGFYQHGYGPVMELLTDYLRGQVRAGAMHIEHTAIAADQFADGLLGEPTRRLALGIVEEIAPRELDLRLQTAVRGFLAAYRKR